MNNKLRKLIRLIFLFRVQKSKIRPVSPTHGFFPLPHSIGKVLDIDILYKILVKKLVKSGDF